MFRQVMLVVCRSVHVFASSLQNPTLNLTSSGVLSLTVVCMYRSFFFLVTRCDILVPTRTTVVGYGAAGRHRLVSRELVGFQ